MYRRRNFEGRIINELFEGFLNLYRNHDYKNRRILNIVVGVIAFLALLFFSNYYLTAHRSSNNYNNMTETYMSNAHLGSINLTNAIDTGVEDIERERVHRSRGRSYTRSITYSYYLVLLNDGQTYMPVRMKKSDAASILSSHMMYGYLAITSDTTSSTLMQTYFMQNNLNTNNVKICQYTVCESNLASSFLRSFLCLLLTIWCIFDTFYCSKKISEGYVANISNDEDLQIKRAVSSMGIDYTQLSTMNDDLDDWMQREEKKQQHMDQNIDNQGFESWKDQKEDDWKARVEAENKQNTDDDYYSSSLSLKRDK